MILRALFTNLLLALATLLHAQHDPLTARHARINALYEAQRFPELIREIDAQVAGSAGTTWADSLHRYLYKYGRAHRKLKGAGAGTAAAERMYALVKERGKANNELEALFDLSWTYYDVGEMKQCARVDSLAVAVADADPDVPIAQKGRARQYLAFDHSVIGDHARSAYWAQAALDVYAKADSIKPAQWAESYTAVGVAYWHLGRIRAAEEQYLRAIKVLGDATDEAILVRKVSTYGNLGVLWQNAGDLARAKSYYLQSLHYSDRVIAAATDQFTRDEAIVNRSRTYVNLATVYFQAGDPGKARELLDLAWRDRSGVLEPDDAQLIAIKERYADLELNAGNLAKAGELQRAYLLACERRFGTRSEEYIRAASKLGDILARQERFAQADSLFAASMSAGAKAMIPETDAVLARTRMSRAAMYMKAGRWSEALTELEQARKVYTAIYDSAHHKVAQVDALRAEAAFGAGDVTAARNHAVSALRLVDERAQALRKSALPRAFPEPHILPDAIHWKVRTELTLAGPSPTAGKWKEWNADIDLAILALERNKAAVEDEASKLLLVAAQKRLFDLAIDVAFASNEALGMQAAAERFLTVSEAGRSTLLKGRLNAFKGLRFAGLPDSLASREQELIAGLSIGDEGANAAATMLTNEAAFAAFLEGLMKDHPAYFALRYGGTTITAEEVRQRLLRPARALVVYARTAFNLYALVLTTDSARLVKLEAAALDDRVRTLNTSIASRDVAGYVTMAHALHEQLVAPLGDRIAGRELLIIPDGPLHLLNFECLLTAPGTPAGFKEHLLLHDHAIAYLLSATTALQFAQLAQDHARGALALAPGFTDELKQEYLARVTDSSQVDRDFLRHVRQPFAMRTAEGLGSTLRAQLLLGSLATERGLRERASQFGILHLGTHAEMNATDPMYSRLVLSKDGAGVDADADGYLHAYEIYELDLRAQLAVLTACETGTGMNEAGEGVRSLGYSFAFAGCPSLITSLWSIDEKVSAEIIERFYAHLADGLPKHEALRKAKLEHLAAASDELALPFYWAGLVLIGDVEPVEMTSTWQRPVMWGLGGLAAVLIALAVRRRNRSRNAPGTT
ncbi:MAG: CHAT domain-containing protein [Flavobacteriales bacterium]